MCILPKQTLPISNFFLFLNIYLQFAIFKKFLLINKYVNNINMFFSQGVPGPSGLKGATGEMGPPVS